MVNDIFLSAIPLPLPPRDYWAVGAGHLALPRGLPLGGTAGARLLLWLRFFPNRKALNERIAAVSPRGTPTWPAEGGSSCGWGLTDARP